jgi:hypothetical protein
MDHLLSRSSRVRLPAYRESSPDLAHRIKIPDGTTCPKLKARAYPQPAMEFDGTVKKESVAKGPWIN